MEQQKSKGVEKKEEEPVSPPGWKEYRNEEGTRYWWNEKLRKASWSCPVPSGGPELPAGWAEYEDDDGQKYYYDETERKTTWTHPATEGGYSHRS